MRSQYVCRAIPPRREKAPNSASFRAFSCPRDWLAWVVMIKHKDPLELATKYHEALPKRIRVYLNRRGIPDVLIDFYLLGWNGIRITIPIRNREGHLVFFKLGKDPEDTLPGPKMLAPPGVRIE